MFIRTDPDRWYPEQRGIGYKSGERLAPDDLVIWDRKPYRVAEIRPVEQVDWPEKYRDTWIQWGMPNPATWSGRPMVVVIRHEDHPGEKPVHLQGSASTTWRTLPEHYAICRLCHELPPCTHVHNEAVMEHASERMAEQMSILPGTCHACREPITRRQKSFTFPGPNLIRPDFGDDSAVFHTRGKCLSAVRSYDRRWAAARHGRARLFFCEGTMTIHHDGTAECDNPGCVAKGARKDLVDHRCRVWHHPGHGPGVQGCWCLAGEAQLSLGGQS